MCSVELPAVLAMNNVLPEAGKFLQILLKVYTKHQIPLHADVANFV